MLPPERVVPHDPKAINPCGLMCGLLQTDKPGMHSFEATTCWATALGMARTPPYYYACEQDWSHCTECEWDPTWAPGEGTFGYTFRPVIKCLKCSEGYELRNTCWGSECRSGFTGCQPKNDSGFGHGTWNAAFMWWDPSLPPEVATTSDIAPLLDEVLDNEI